VCVLTRVRRTQRLGVVLLGRWTRSAVGQTRWGGDDDALRLVVDRAEELHLDMSVTGEVRALPTSLPEVEVVLDLAQDDPDLAEPEEPADAGADPFAVRPFLQWVAERHGPAPTAAPAAPPEPVQPGSVVSLEPGDLAAPLTLSVSTRTGTDVDVCALLLGPDGRVRGDRDLVFYNAPASPAGAVRLGLAESVGAMTRSSISVDVSRLADEDVARVALVISADPVALRRTRGTAAVLLRASGPELPLPLPPETDVTAAVVAEVYQRGEHGPWRVRAVGQGWSDGLGGLVRSYGVSVD
jgi:stress response protein SCP2